MKIVLTGGGTGGHFYPIIAVAQALNKIAKEENLVDVELYYMAPQKYDDRALFENNLKFIKGTAGKRRHYFSIFNFFDLFKTGWGICTAFWKIFSIYPDVVFGKGGYVSFPALVAARFFRIPIVIHESDSSPGRVNKWAGKFAQRVAISYPDAAEFFPKDKVAHTGNPIRQDIMHADHNGSHEFFGLEEGVPVYFIIGGSLGSELINDTILDGLEKLIQKYQIIHQTGVHNFEVVKKTAEVVLYKSEFKNRYKPYDNLDPLTLRMAAGAADIIISRAGSTIFEIALWEVPAILIPITASNGNNQRKNAYSYARTGAAEVIEEGNLTSHILSSEIDRLMSDSALREKMKLSAKTFARTNAAETIAREIIAVAREHEK